MKRVSFPIAKNAQGPTVTDLHSALESLGYQIPAAEKARQQFADATAKAVTQFQKENRLPLTGTIDEATALALNKLAGDAEIIGELKGHGTKLGTIEKTLGAQGTTLGIIDSKLGEHGGKLGSIDTKLSEEAAKLGDVAAKLGAQTGTLTNVDTKLADHGMKLGAIDTKLGEQTGKLGTIAQHTEKLGSIEKRLGEQTTELGKQTSQLGAIQAGLAELGDPSKYQRLVRGLVRVETGDPFPGCLVRAFHIVAQGQGNARLGEDRTDADGAYTIRYGMVPGEKLIQLAVVVVDERGKALCEPTVIQQAKPLETVNLIVPGIDINPYRVVGKVASRVTAAKGGLRVVIVDKAVGGDVPLKETTTDDNGTYEAIFSDRELRRRGKAQPDLQARVFTGDVFLGASDVHYNASRSETLNILLEEKATSALQSEHEVLTGSLSKHFAGKLGDLKETDEQQDITYLANKTGWDARAVALAALADQFSARTKGETGATTIAQPFFYALFRAGLPANEDTLFHTHAKTLEGVWKQAAEQGVIPQVSAEDISNFVSRFQALGAQKLLTGPALVGTSPLSEMLRVSNLNDAQQKRFAQLYTENRADMPAFWKAMTEDKAFGATLDERAKTAARLQLDGKLGFLTINNAPLIQKIRTKAGGGGVADPLHLAQMGYHKAQTWTSLLTGDIPIPKEIPGDTSETKRVNYASYLAAQVRLSYPTAAIAQMVKSGELPLKGTEEGVSGQVHAFLTGHQGQFEIGVEPVEQYLKRNNIPVTPELEKVVAQVKRVQRVYQITSSDQALTGLMKHGIDAAYHIVRYDRDAFVGKFAADMGGAHQAALTYDRSVQVHNTVLNIALGYLHACTAPSIGVHTGAHVSQGILNPTPAHTSDIIPYATLESLFGSMDFCACDHCRSILSPAAYLVDLLQFLGSDEKVWTDFVGAWKSPLGGHEGAPYPFTNQAAFTQAGSPSNTEISPFDVLMSRRPDIQHLPLTCENTNTALPYIDLVNETLEYYIVNGLTLEENKVGEYLGHDTNGVESEDLLASPQFVMDAAYTTLRNARFPAPLPFHQLLEYVRRYYNKLEVPLSLAMERLRKADDLERGANPYGWRDVWLEEVGLSRDEYEILADTNTVPLWRMYGFPNGTTDPLVIAGLSNAKQFARRLNITYEDLIAVLRTRFINPNSGLIPKLDRLGVNFVMLAELKNKNDAATDAKFDDLLANLADPPDPAAYGADPNAPKNDYAPIRTWVKNEDNYARIMGLVTLAIPMSAWARGKAYTVGDCVRPNTLRPESPLYFECAKSGISAQLEPEQWPTAPGETYKNDGTVVWICRDASSCHSFDNLAFRYSDPAKLNQNIGAAEFIRLLRFIRLWKKLGWTIEQTDATICALYPPPISPQKTFAETIDAVNELNNSFKALLPRLGIIRRVMPALNLTVKRDLLPLLACFAPIGTHEGAEWFIDKDQSRRLRPVPSYYRQLFLTPALLAQDAAFADNGYGEFLSDPTKKLVDHAEALRSAFNLTGDEFALIVAALPANPNLLDRNQNNDLLLTLRNVSEIFRRSWLARKLKLSVRELLLLIQLTGLDPFAVPDPTNPAILRLISLVQAMKDRAPKSAVVLYLIWNQDLSGKSAPDLAQITGLARTLRSDFASIDDQFAAFDPEHACQRKRQQVLHRLSAVAGMDLVLTKTILDPELAPYTLHAVGDQDKPALDDMLALETPGLAVQFKDPVTGNPIESDPIAKNLDYASGGSNSLPNAGNLVSGTWRGQIEVPESGLYNLIVEADSGAEVALGLDGRDLKLTMNGNVRRNTDPLEMKAGVLYKIDLKVEKVQNTLSFKWESPTRAGEVIPACYLYPQTIIEPFAEAYTRFLKAASLATGLGLSANELAYFATHLDYRVEGDTWINKLSAKDNPEAAVAKALYKPFEALLQFARLKAEISPSDESLLTVLKDPATATKDLDSLLFRITRWTQSSLNELLAWFGKSKADLGRFDVFRRIYDVFSLIQKMGVSANALIKATTNEPKADAVRDLQAALRARYDAASWRDVVRPINDEMRGLRRDALVAYILDQMQSHPESEHIDTSNKLFEYFLMDVQMEPCMQTSRIRHALSSVQLFIERCLMNLEPRVSPAAINPKQWEWMKRYRVWEANRKVFLFPENWLEPELRDDKSPFFKEIESELLQSDITEERAVTTLVNYLSKLDEVAKLEPCGIYHIPGDDRTSEINHVVARTSGANRKYYYRRQEDVSWSPWEQIKLDIEDNPVTPVVWNDRLFIFWLRILKDAPLKTPEKVPSLNTDTQQGYTPPEPYAKVANLRATDLTKSMVSTIQDDVIKQSPEEAVQINVKAVLCWSEYYNGKWQPTKTSDVNRPIELGSFPPAGQYTFNRAGVGLLPYEDDGGLRILVQYIPDGRFRSVIMYNTHSLQVDEGDAKAYLDQALSGRCLRALQTSTDKLTGLYWCPSPAEVSIREILQNPLKDDRVVVPPQLWQDAWGAPFLYEDTRHLFFVKTIETQVPLLHHNKYGVPTPSGGHTAAKIPPVVFQFVPKVQVKPKPWDQGDPGGLDMGVIDSAPIERFVTEDAYIHRGIGTRALVSYGDRQIGPSGAIKAVLGTK